MKILIPSLAGLFMLVASCAWAQTTSTLNWNTSFSPAWADGATSGSAKNISSSKIDASVNISKSGGSWIKTFYTSGGMTPSKNGAYNVGTAAPPENLMLALDFGTSSDYVSVDITFSAPVYQLSFAISDVDRHFKNRNDFIDEVVVEANGRTAHPTFSRYMIDPNFPNQLQFVGDTIRVNSNGNLSGNAGPAGYPTVFDAAEQAGTVVVNFGSTPVNNLRIRYGSASGSMTNPSIQAIAIGNISFQSILPLATSSQLNARTTNNSVSLQWDAQNEVAGTRYAVEYSNNGTNFTELANLPARNNGGANHYTYNHTEVPTAKAFYRLKTIEPNGAFTYGTVVTVTGGQSDFSIRKIYPTVFSDQLMLEADIPANSEVYLSTYTQAGVLVSKKAYQVVKGENYLTVNSTPKLAPGTYLFVLNYKNETRTIKAIKQ